MISLGRLFTRKGKHMGNRRTKKLVLNKETVRILSDSQLNDVVGGIMRRELSFGAVCTALSYVPGLGGACLTRDLGEAAGDLLVNPHGKDGFIKVVKTEWGNRTGTDVCVPW